MLIDTMTGIQTGAVTRRGLLGGMGAGVALAATPSLAAAGKGPIRALDVNDPRENLYGFAKMWGTIGARPVISAYQGVQYAVVGKKRATPLFGFYGFANIRNAIQPDGSVKVMGKECGYFVDLASGKILDTWDNPWTGEKVETWPFLNDKFRGTLGLTRKVYEVNGSKTVNNDAKGGSDAEPFRLPWQAIGDQYLLGWDYAHEYVNPVTPEGWPKASSGRMVNPSEHFVLYTPRAEIDDRSVESARYHGGFMRQGPWWPWMKMGQSGVDGVLMGRMHSYKITGTHDDIPRVVLDRVVKDRPDLLTDPTDGPDAGVVDTFGKYARDVPPEVSGHGKK
ncbi:DUF1838 family protein [Novosphingobium taihuense]|uniref:DUF1838 domain-containing protein n=1 Tax=Novosphingobium taihuense TaxID=260085 RepID=A0A7W7AD73_9SPHN|nr:DUF1838 family protein [Novosphingobium taihuense]MBB4614827.1 hypothetical protein [Novosphingobium taihuense]TWH84731.1 uncharacterized protein DUF1838 [Novosphingobium taihuense]